MSTDKTNKEKEALELKVTELENSWKRALADFQNLQKRTQEEKEAIIKFANEVLIGRLVFVLENLEYLTKHIEDKGLELIFKEFKQILSDEGLKEIDVQDQEFDPTTMEASESIELTEENSDGKVLETVTKGYVLKNKVLKPARVKVGKYIKEA